MSKNELLKLCPTHYQTPQIIGLPKIHKENVSWRPIIGIIRSIFSPVSRLLADIFKSYVFELDSFVMNSMDVIRKLQHIDIDNGTFFSLDVDSLFTNVPITETLEAFRDLLCGDDNLAEQTIFSMKEILKTHDCFFPAAISKEMMKFSFKLTASL